MKNHIKVNGQLLQTNKKWSHLKQRQQTWICDITQEEYSRYIEKYKNQTYKKSKLTVIDRVYDSICEKNIWIPYDEAAQQISKFIDRLNRKLTVNVLESGEVTIAKTPHAPVNVTPQMKYSVLPDEIKEIFAERMRLDIGLIINQSNNPPSNKTRDKQIKAMLSGFNRKQYKEVGYKAAWDESVVSVYDDIRNELYDSFLKNGKLPLNTKMERFRKSLTVLETERLVIRKMALSDLKSVSQIISDIEVMYAWERAFTTKQETRDWIIKQLRRYKHEQVGYFLAVEKISGQIIGQIGLMWNEIKGEKILEVGYILKKEYWHKGFAVEGAKACLKYGFELYDIDCIYATIRPENVSSIAVALKIGMKYTGFYDKVYDDKPMKHNIYRIYRNEVENGDMLS